MPRGRPQEIAVRSIANLSLKTKILSGFLCVLLILAAAYRDGFDQLTETVDDLADALIGRDICIDAGLRGLELRSQPAVGGQRVNPRQCLGQPGQHLC
jgi:hypothetical protein